MVHTLFPVPFASQTPDKPPLSTILVSFCHFSGGDGLLLLSAGGEFACFSIFQVSIESNLHWHRKQRLTALILKMPFVLGRYLRQPERTILPASLTLNPLSNVDSDTSGLEKMSPPIVSTLLRIAFCVPAGMRTYRSVCHN